MRQSTDPVVARRIGRVPRFLMLAGVLAIAGVGLIAAIGPSGLYQLIVY